MGEVAKEGDAAGNDGDGGDRKGGSSCGVVKWERFLTRKVLRVLLVEADDSTRQIILALLRKCNYRVAAVSDGLKAWEILKGRPHSIDLILTEVDLPSISGYPLLTLIMEHDVCKNIPVIMMSSQDSISTVYKCMMRGAADYLVKPIRTNELRNLWQHVWRRQLATAGTTGKQDECAALQKVEATAENNAASNHSSVNRDKELIEKGSDAQSSCTKPDLDADIREIEQKGNANEMDILTPEAVRSSDRRLLGQDKGSDEGLAVARLSQNKDTDPKVPTNDTIVASGCNDVIVNSYKEAINLIGAFDNHPQSFCMDSSSNYGTREAQPELGLSLRQSDPSCLTDHKTGERHTLRQSDASAFSRYTSKPLCFVQSGLANFQNQDQEFARNTEEDVSCAVRGYDTDNLDTVEGSRNLARHSEYHVQQQAQQRVFPAPIPVRGLMRNLSTDYGSLPRAAEPFVRVDSFQQSCCENINFGDQNDVKFDSLEDHGGGHISPTTDRSGSSSFCNGALTHLNSMDGGSICGSNENNVNQFPVSRPTPVGKTMVGEETTTTVQRSILREAALAKFRLKRKDRCYEKKVRYESRKKLAEQRPRVKGQFVRQTN